MWGSRAIPSPAAAASRISTPLLTRMAVFGVQGDEFCGRRGIANRLRRDCCRELPYACSRSDRDFGVPERLR